MFHLETQHCVYNMCVCACVPVVLKIIYRQDEGFEYTDEDRGDSVQDRFFFYTRIIFISRGAFFSS